MQGQSPCPRSAERGTPLCFIKRRRGSKGEPSPGVPPFSLLLCVCAVSLGGFRCPVLPFDPISLVLAQRNGVEQPKKGAFLPWWLHHPRERCQSVVFTHLRPTWAGGWWVSERLPSPGANGICYGRFARAVELVGVTVVIRFRPPPKRVSLGLHPVSLRKSKEMGWNGQ